MFKVKVFHDYGDAGAYPHVVSHPYYPLTRAYAFALARRLTGQQADAYTYGEVYEHDAGDWVPAFCPAMHEAAMRGDWDDEIPW